MVGRLKNYVTDIDKAELDILRCRRAPGMSLAELEKAWSQMKVSAKEAARIA